MNVGVLSIKILSQQNKDLGDDDLWRNGEA